jgi:putative FmdB family regulatory protein
MPTYSYLCKDCGQAIEVQQSFSDPALTSCESCGGELRKQFGNLAVSFKGSGFYRTDSAAQSSGAQNAGAKSATPAPKTDSGSTASSN